MKNSCLLLCACVILSPYAAVAKDGDIDEYAVRQQIRKLHPTYTRDQETQIFLLHKLSPDLFKFDTNFDGRIDDRELAKAVAAVKDSNSYQGQLNDYRRGAQPIPNRPTPGGGQTEPMPGEPARQAVFILRQKFDQVSSFAFPGEGDEDATGALFSYGRDNVIHNNVWTAQGVAAVMFGQSYPSLNQESQRFASRVSYAAGPYVQFDKLSNSNASQQKSNLDNLSPGLMGELGLQNMSIGNAAVTNYLRLKGYVNADFEGIAKSWNVAGEWQPVSNAPGFTVNAPLPVDFLHATVTPMFKVQAIYSGILGNTTQPIFAHHNEAFRVGPNVGLLFAPVKLGAYWPAQLQNMSLTVSYSLLQDLMSPATYNLFDASFTYFTDDNKTVGLTLSYERGQVQQTGASSDTFLAGLSLKLYQDLRPVQQ